MDIRGTCSCICEPQRGGWRHVEVTERRTVRGLQKHQMRWLVDEAYPDAEVVRLVSMDNLNTHQLGALYEAFEPCEARRIAQRLEFHYTPGAWQLAETMAETRVERLQQRVSETEPYQLDQSRSVRRPGCGRLVTASATQQNQP